jgi:hypothetical protein
MVYLMTLSVAQDHIALNYRMNNKYRKDMEGNNHEGTGENH